MLLASYSTVVILLPKKCANRHNNVNVNTFVVDRFAAKESLRNKGMDGIGMFTAY